MKQGGAQKTRNTGKLLRTLGISGAFATIVAFFDKIKAKITGQPLPKGKPGVPKFFRGLGRFFTILNVFGYTLDGIATYQESKERGNTDFQAGMEGIASVGSDVTYYASMSVAGGTYGAAIGGTIGGILGAIFGMGGGAIPGAALGAKFGYQLGSIAGPLLGSMFPKTAQKFLGFNPENFRINLKKGIVGFVNRLTGADKDTMDKVKKRNEERNKKRGAGFRYGGIIKAPESGAFVKLHGLEEIRPLDADGLMKNSKIASLSFDSNVANIIDLTTSSQKMDNQMGATPSSDVSAITVPTIPSADYKNNFPAQAERYFNVVPV
jgi:hypothetical protein